MFVNENLELALPLSIYSLQPLLKEAITNANLQ